MSAWHRQHPELAGTDADPWMHNPGHRKAFEDLVRDGLIDDPNEPDPWRPLHRASEDDE